MAHDPTNPAWHTQHPIETDVQAQIIAQAARGIPNTAIAENVGIHQQTVAKYRKRLKDKIEAISQRYILEAGEKVLEADIAILRQAAQIMADNQDEKGKVKKVDLSDYEQVILAQAEPVRKRVCAMMGLTPASTPSTIIQLIYNDNRQSTVAPEVLALLGGCARPALDGPDVIDIEALMVQDTADEGGDTDG